MRQQRHQRNILQLPQCLFSPLARNGVRTYYRTGMLCRPRTIVKSSPVENPCSLERNPKAHANASIQRSHRSLRHTSLPHQPCRARRVAPRRRPPIIGQLWKRRCLRHGRPEPRGRRRSTTGRARCPGIKELLPLSRPAVRRFCHHHLPAIPCIRLARHF